MIPIFSCCILIISFIFNAAYVTIFGIIIMSISKFIGLNTELTFSACYYLGFAVTFLALFIGSSNLIGEIIIRVLSLQPTKFKPLNLDQYDLNIINLPVFYISEKLSRPFIIVNNTYVIINKSCLLQPKMLQAIVVYCDAYIKLNGAYLNNLITALLLVSQLFKFLKQLHNIVNSAVVNLFPGIKIVIFILSKILYILFLPIYLLNIFELFYNKYLLNKFILFLQIKADNMVLLVNNKDGLIAYLLQAILINNQDTKLNLRIKNLLS